MKNFAVGVAAVVLVVATGWFLEGTASADGLPSARFGTLVPLLGCVASVLALPRVFAFLAGDRE